MEKENWKIGLCPSEVVSDTKIQNTNFPFPPNPKESPDADIELYGGYLVCESIANPEHAKLIANAPETARERDMLLGVLKEIKELSDNGAQGKTLIRICDTARVAIEKIEKL